MAHSPAVVRTGRKGLKSNKRKEKWPSKRSGPLSRQAGHSAVLCRQFVCSLSSCVIRSVPAARCCPLSVLSLFSVCPHVRLVARCCPLSGLSLFSVCPHVRLVACCCPLSVHPCSRSAHVRLVARCCPLSGAHVRPVPASALCTSIAISSCGRVIALELFYRCLLDCIRDFCHSALNAVRNFAGLVNNIITMSYSHLFTLSLDQKIT